MQLLIGIHFGDLPLDDDDYSHHSKTVLLIKCHSLQRASYMSILIKNINKRPHAADRPATRLGEPSTAPGRVEGGGQPVLSFEQCFILFCSFPLPFAFVVGGLGFEFCVFVAGWRHALRSKWPFIIIIIITVGRYY